MARLTMKSVRENKKSGGYNNDIWTPMGQLERGKSATIRLLPYLDKISQSIYTARSMLNMSFVNPENDEEEWTVMAPCLEMYTTEERCPMASVVRDMFSQSDDLLDAGQSDESKLVREAALAHWKKWTYYYQGFILNGGTEEVDPNKIVPIIFPKAIHKLIDSASDSDSDFDMLPSGEFSEEDVALLLDGEKDPDMSEDEFMALFVGRPIKAKKGVTSDGKHNSYTDSAWDFKEHMLSDEQLAYIASEGFVDQRKFLPKQPTPEQYEVYGEMMTISTQAALGNADNTWNPEWETVYGIKPRKPKTASAGSTASASSVKDRLAAKLDKSGGDKPAAREALSAGRGKANSARKEQASSADSGASDGDAKPAGKPRSKLAERLAAAKAQAEAEA